MVASNKVELLVLSARFLGGVSESQESQWWREYLLSDVSNITVLPDKFFGPRPGYKPNGEHHETTR